MMGSNDNSTARFRPMMFMVLLLGSVLRLPPLRSKLMSTWHVSNNAWEAGGRGRSPLNLIVGEREARSVKMSLHMLECLWTSWGASWGSFPLCCCLLLQNSTLNPKPLPVVLCIQRQRHNVSHDRIVRESLGRTFRPNCLGKPWADIEIIL